MRRSLVVVIGSSLIVFLLLIVATVHLELTGRSSTPVVFIGSLLAGISQLALIIWVVRSLIVSSESLSGWIYVLLAMLYVCGISMFANVYHTIALTYPSQFHVAEETPEGHKSPDIREAAEAVQLAHITHRAISANRDAILAAFHAPETPQDMFGYGRVICRKQPIRRSPTQPSPEAYKCDIFTSFLVDLSDCVSIPPNFSQPHGPAYLYLDFSSKFSPATLKGLPPELTTAVDDGAITSDELSDDIVYELLRRMTANGEAYRKEVLEAKSSEKWQAEFASGTFWYFSCVTMTTLGYGDIYPIGTPARVAVACQTIFGVLYLGLLIGAVAKQNASQKESDA